MELSLRKLFKFAGMGISLLALLLALSACTQKTGQQTPSSGDASETAQEAPASPAPSASVQTQATPSIVLTADDVPAPASIPDLTLTEAQVYAMVGEMAKAAQLYYDKYNDQAEMVCKNGFLYDYPSKAYMTSQLLVENGGLNSQYAEQTAMILYVNPSDLQGLNGFTLPRQDNEANMIVAVYETEDGFVLSNASGDSGKIAKADMQALFEKYNANHGDVTRYAADSAEFAAIMAGVYAYRGDEAPVDVRYLVADQKHAYVVCSPVGKPAEIKAYALINNANTWQVEMADFERTYQSKKAISEQLPGFNLTIAPKFDLYFQLKYVNAQFDGLINAMKSQGLLSDNDGAITFISGTEEAVYVTFESGARFVGSPDEEGVWVMHEVPNYLAAESYLQENISMPPLFIVKQE